MSGSGSGNPTRVHTFALVARHENLLDFVLDSRYQVVVALRAWAVSNDLVSLASGNDSAVMPAVFPQHSLWTSEIWFFVLSHLDHQLLVLDFHLELTVRLRDGALELSTYFDWKLGVLHELFDGSNCHSLLAILVEKTVA